MSHNSKSTKSSTRTKMKSMQNNENKAKNSSEDLNKLWKNKVFSSFKDSNPNKMPESKEVGETKDIHEIYVNFIDKLFDDLIDLGYIYNETNKNVQPELTWSRPSVSKDGFKSSSSNNIVIGRLSTKKITLIVRGSEPSLKAYIIPVDRLISFSSNPRNFNAYLELELSIDILKWTLDGNILPKNGVSLLAKKLFEALTEAITNNEFPAEALKYADLSPKSTLNNHIQSQIKSHEQIKNQEAFVNQANEEVDVSEFHDNAEDIESIKSKLLSKIDAGPQFWSTQKNNGETFELLKPGNGNTKNSDIKPSNTNADLHDTVISDQTTLELKRESIVNDNNDSEATLELKRTNISSSTDIQNKVNESVAQDDEEELFTDLEIVEPVEILPAKYNDVSISSDAISNVNDDENVKIVIESKNQKSEEINTDEKNLSVDIYETVDSIAHNNDENSKLEDLEKDINEIDIKDEKINDEVISLTNTQSTIIDRVEPVQAKDIGSMSSDNVDKLYLDKKPEKEKTIINSNLESSHKEPVKISMFNVSLNNEIESLLKQLSTIGSEAFLNLDYNKANKIISISSQLQEFNKTSNEFFAKIKNEIESI